MRRDTKATQELVRLVRAGWTVDPYGRVLDPMGQERKQWLKAGYWALTVGPSDARRQVLVHRLVGYLKFGERVFTPGLVLRHKDNDGTNNSWTNIVLGTPSQNMMDRPPHERKAHAQRAANATRRLSEAEVRSLRADRKRGMTYKMIGAKYGIPKSTISYIIHRKTYSTVD